MGALAKLTAVVAEACSKSKRPCKTPDPFLTGEAAAPRFRGLNQAVASAPSASCGCWATALPQTRDFKRGRPGGGKPEVQGDRRASPQPVDGWPPPPCQDTGQIGLGPTLVASFYLITSLKTPSPVK